MMTSLSLPLLRAVLRVESLGHSALRIFERHAWLDSTPPSCLDAINCEGGFSLGDARHYQTGPHVAELHRWLVGAGGGSSGWDFRATVLCVFFWSRLQRQVPSRAAARAAKVPLY